MPATLDRPTRRTFGSFRRGRWPVHSTAMGPREAPRPTRGRRSTAFAKRLTAARLAAGLTQAQLAEKLGVSLRTLHGWENGDTEPRGKLQVQAVAAFVQSAPKRRPV